MIKAVFFDWFNTLARYEPPREVLQSQVLAKFGIHVSPQEIMPALFIADRNFFEENAIPPVRERSPEEQAKIYARYQQTILTEAGVGFLVEPDMLMRIMKKVHQLSRGMRFVLFDDVLPTLKRLKGLKEQSFITGLLTNLKKDMKPICRELGIDPYLNFTVTSGELGFDKPQAPFFMAALQQAGVDASEAIHVGDQYKIDVVGAKGVGINPILLDRYNLYPETSDCPRIHSLTELTDYL
ncbi:HAD family hydrolase [Chloroflexota bacterium]